MAKTVVGLFDTANEAQNVVQDLVTRGFSRNDISVVANDAATQGTTAQDASYGDTDYADAGTGSNAAKGAGTGAVIGGLAGLLVGLGALAIPGIGPVIAAGPLAATLAGAGIGAVAGGLIGALVHQGVPEHEAHYYAEGVRRGGTLVTVNSPDDMAEVAVDIFHEHGAVDIDRRADEYRETGFTQFDPNAEPYTPQQTTREEYQAPAATAAPANLQNTDNVTIPVVEEELQVGKREVQHGGVRIYSRVTEQPVEETVQLREEHVNVDRHPVDRAVTDSDLSAFKEGTIEMTETAEEAVVAKQARVVEEVTVNKNATERTETVHDTVRRTDVDVEELNEGATLNEDRTLNNENVSTNRSNI